MADLTGPNPDEVNGVDARGVTVTAKPVLVGGTGNSSAPTAVTAGQAVDAWFGLQGQAVVASASVVSSADGVTANEARLLGPTSNSAAAVAALGYLYNGTTLDRLRSSPGVTGAAAVGGLTAADGVLAAAPVTIGVRASTALPSAMSADGDVVNLWATRNGVLITARADSAGTLEGVYAAPSDAQSNAQTMGNSNVFPQVYNGTTWDRLRSTEALSTAPNVTTGILAVGSGPGYDRKLNPSSLATAVNSAITNTVDGADVFAYYIGTSTTGTYTFEVTADDTNWVAALWVNAKTGAISSGNLTPTSGDVYAVTTSGWRQVRVRTVTTLGATMAVKTTATLAGTLPTTVRALTGGRALDVAILDGSGNQVTSFGGGTQYVGDAAATSTPTGTVAMGLANASAPTDVSANNDAVAQWMLRNGSTVVNLASGGTLITFPASAALADSAANPTTTGFAAYGMVYDGTNWSRVRGPGSDANAYTGYAGALGLLWSGTAWDRARSIESVSAAPNVTTGLAAVGLGPGFDLKTNPTGVAATSTANAVTVITNGADLMAFHVTTIGTTPGSMIFETTNDDTNWATAGFVVKQSSGPDLRVEGAFVPAVNDVYLVRVTGMRQVRYRVNAVYASGTATVKVTASTGVGMIKGIDLAAPPHNIGYAILSATAQYSTTQTSVVLGPTVTSTQRMVVTAVQIQTGGTTAGTHQVYFGTGAYSRGTSKAIFDGEWAPSSTLKPGAILTPSTPFEGAADEEVRITTSAAINPLTVTIWYYLVTA